MNKLKSKQRAIGLLLVFGTILVLVATWDLPDGRSIKWNDKPGGISGSTDNSR